MAIDSDRRSKVLTMGVHANTLTAGRGGLDASVGGGGHRCDAASGRREAVRVAGGDCCE